MKLLLINPPDKGALNPELDPPFHLLLLAQSLNRSIDVEIAEWANGMPNNIPDADIYGITITTATYDSGEYVASLIRKQNPSAYIIAGGSHAQFMEVPFVDSIFRGNCLYDFTNLLFRHGYHLCTAGNIINGYPIPFNKIKLNKYINNRRIPDATKTLSLLTTIGCKFKCAFCYNKYLNQCQFIISDLLRETCIDLINKYSIDGINVLDDNFLMYPHLYPTFQEVGIKWRASGCVSILQNMDTSELYSSGCRMIYIGVESGSDSMLSKMGKPQSTSSIKDIVNELHDNGIECRATFIVGFPGETWETVEQTANILSIFDSTSTHLFVPYPGSEVWMYPEKYNIVWISNNYSNYRSHLHADTGLLTPVFETKELSVDTLTEMYWYLQEVRKTISE